MSRNYRYSWAFHQMCTKCFQQTNNKQITTTNQEKHLIVLDPSSFKYNHDYTYPSIYFRQFYRTQNDDDDDENKNTSL